MIRRLVHFLAIGALLFALDRRPRAAPPPVALDSRIVVDDARVAEIRDRWRETTGGDPDEAMLRSLVSAAVDEEVLFREALRAGLDRGDAVVWHRLVENLRFVSDASARDEADLHREARRLGLERSDPVVRRRLVERMTEMLRAAARGGDVPSAEVDAWLAAHGDRLRAPDRVSLEHVFFSRSRRGDRALADALSASPPPRGGDPFLHGSELRAASARELERTLGTNVAAAAFRVEVGSWQGPFESPYGAHWIRVRERTAGQADPTKARTRAIAAITREREESGLREGVARLRAGYTVEVRDR